MKYWWEEVKFHVVGFLIVFLPIAWFLEKVFGGVAKAAAISATAYVLVAVIVKILMKKKYDT